jgi:hypothetical protein
MRGVYQRVAATLERYYPSRLHALYMVNVPFPLRLGQRTIQQFLMRSTRAKIKVAKPKDVPCRALPSALRSHKLSTATGLDAWGYAGDAAAGGGGGGQGVLAGGGGGGGGSEADAWSDAAPVTPAGRTPRGGARRGWGGGGGSGSARGGAAPRAGLQGPQQAVGVGVLVTVTMAGVMAALLQKDGALVTGLRALSAAAAAAPGAGAAAARAPL